MVDVEEMQLTLEGELYTLTLSQLTELAEYLEVPIAKYNGKSRMVVLKVICEHVNDVIDSIEDVEVKKDKLATVMNFNKGEPPPLEGDNNSDGNPADNTKQNNETTQQSSQAPKVVNKNMKQVDMSNIFRRDLKIKGQIGSSVESNTMLSFVSLARQIESAVKKGYDEEEIADAIILSITPGLPLRAYVESTPDLTLPRLCQILRSHYREGNATDLYHKLSSLTQLPQEDGSSFLMRALELRQKIIFASKKADVSIKYNEELVQSQFLHTIDMGLRDDGVRIHMQPFLKKGKVSDEELIREMNISVSQETERRNKLSVKKSSESEKAAKSSVETTATDKPKKTNVVETLLSEVESLRGTINAMMANQQQSQQQPNVYKPSNRKPRLCSNCQSQKKEKCEHCFYCGSGEHFARGCRKKPRGNQGNLPRPPQRDK